MTYTGVVIVQINFHSRFLLLNFQVLCCGDGVFFDTSCSPFTNLFLL